MISKKKKSRLYPPNSPLLSTVRAPIMLRPEPHKVREVALPGTANFLIGQSGTENGTCLPPNIPIFYWTNFRMNH